MTDTLPSKERLAVNEKESVALPEYYVVVTTADVWQTFCKTRAEADFIVSKPFHKGYYVLEVYTRRAAMLPGNSPVIGIDPSSGPDRAVEVRYFAPPGYAMVPIEPTENMVIAGFESAPALAFSKPDEWDAYQAMSGCEQAAHRARLCWSAMLAAVPEANIPAKALEITLPDSSSKAFWSGSGKTEVFFPETYKRWVKEAIERDCCIAQIDVRVK